MKNDYKSPELEVIEVELRDVLTLSNGGEGEGSSSEWEDVF